MTEKQKRKLLLDELKSRINSKVEIGPFDLDGHSLESLKTLIEDIYQRYVDSQCVTEYLLGSEGVNRFCGTWIWSEKGNKITLDSRLNSILGNEAALTEISENRFRTYFNDDDFREIKREIDSPDQNKDSKFQLQHKMKHKELGETWVLTRGSVVYSDGAKEPLIVASVTDINDLKAKEELYAESEARYQALFDTSIDGYLIIDSDTGKIEFANKSAARFLDFSVTELLTKTMDDLILSGQEQPEISILEKLSQSKKTELNLVYCKQDGEERHVDINCLSTVVDKKDYFICSLKDVTQTQELVNQLKEKEKFLQDIMDNSTALVYLKDSNGKYLMVNDTFGKLFTSDVEGKTDYDLFPKEYADRFHKIDKDLCTTGIPIELEEIAPVDGVDHYYLTNKFPLKNAAGEINGICGISTDITALKHAQQKIQESRDALYTTLRSVPAILIDIEEDGLVNEIWTSDEDKLFLPREELVNHNIKNFFTKETYDLCMSAINDAKENGYHQGTVIELNISGTTRFYELTINPKTTSSAAKSTFITVAYDITDRMLNRKALAESEEKFRQYISHAPVAIIILDEKAKICEVNDIACKMLGYSSEEITNLSIPDAVSNESLYEAMRGFEFVKNNGKIEQEIQFLHKDGYVFWVSLRAVRLSPTKFIAFCSDINESKLIAQKLKDSEEKFKQYVQHAPSGIFIADEHGRYMEVNEAGCEMTGYSELEILSMSIPEMVDPSMVEETIEQFEILKEVGYIEQEFQIRRKDGSQFWVSLKGVALSPTKFMSFCSDITEHKSSEQKLKESEKRLKQYISFAPDSIFVVNERGEYLKSNEAASRLLGYGSEELCKMNIPEVVDPEMLDETMQAFATLRETGSIEQEVRLKNKDGSLIWVSIKAVALSPTRFMSFCSDITIRKKAEEELQSARDRLATTLNALPDLLFEFDFDGLILDYRAPQLEKLYLPPEMFLGKTVQEVLPKEAAEVIMGAIKEAVLVGHSGSAVYKLEMPKGLKWFEISIAASETKESSLIALIRDITDRKETEEALSASEELLSSITRNALDQIFVKNEKRQYVFVNKAMQKVLGLPKEEIIGKTPEEIFGQAQDHIITEVDDRTFAGETVHEVRSLVIGGKELFLDTVQTPLSTENGKISSIMGIVRDLTKHKQSEEALRVSEEIFKSLVTNSEEIIFIVGRDGIFQLSEGKGLSKLGLKPGQVVGKSIFDLYEDFPDMLDKIKEAFAGKTVSSEVCIGGNYFKSWYTPQLDNAGEVIGLLGMSVNVTDQKQFDKTLRASEAKYRLLIETTNDSIVVHWDKKILFANKSLLELLEVKEEEVLGNDILDFIHLDDKEQVIREYGEAESTSFRLVSRSGKVIYVEVNSSSFEWMGSTAILSAITDVTNLIKSQESELELRAQLTASDRMYTIGQMAAGVAHEVNNPLTVLHGMLEEMVTSIQGISQTDIETMLRVSGRIRKIIKGLLSFSRQVETDLSKVDILELVDSTLSLITSLFEKKGVCITVNALDNNLYVKGNQGQLQQVLVNLLFNAIDAMPKGGNIIISISRNKSNVLLSIEDNGIGIPDENLKEIFLPFFTTKEIGKGTGLGLSICQGFVADHGGSIEVESKESIGTTFFVYLPLSI